MQADHTTHPNGGGLAQYTAARHGAGGPSGIRTGRSAAFSHAR
jgi:hypothetical protein